jgi:hypothetical protein
MGKKISRHIIRNFGTKPRGGLLGVKEREGIPWNCFVFIFATWKCLGEENPDWQPSHQKNGDYTFKYRCTVL